MFSDPKIENTNSKYHNRAYIMYGAKVILYARNVVINDGARMEWKTKRENRIRYLYIAVVYVQKMRMIVRIPIAKTGDECSVKTITHYYVYWLISNYVVYCVQNII